LLRRAVHGRFLVFTDRRILLFAYHRLWDVPIARPLWAESSADCTATLQVAERRLVLTGTGPGERDFKVAAVRKADLERYAVLMARV
jgi:predicted transglutaminase-like cysteine proteinase